ncbi:MAG: metallophosphoesterase [Clostridia bacterium]|nr:metallophosphoesterase [Clostridia bacterium]
MIYAISDLHLSLGTNKPMHIFGSRWQDHAKKLESRWRALVKPEDTVVVPGDISWADSLADAETDFRFIESLPGTKLIGKGNHDFWWTSAAKMQKALDSWGVKSVKFLHNNAYRVDDKVICGSRGWFTEEKQQNTVEPVDYAKLVARECMRVELSLTEGAKLADDTTETIVFLHFPPVYGDFRCDPLTDVLLKHCIRRCYYGHIHGNYTYPAKVMHRGIELCMISADFLDFYPVPVR